MVKRPKVNAYTVQYNIGNNILRNNMRFYRLQHNLTQKQLSIRTGLQRTYLAEIESGKRNPTITKVYQIALGLHIEPWRLLKPVTLKEKLYGIENDFTALDFTVSETKLLSEQKYMDILIETIRINRKKKGWSQKDLATYSGLSEIFIRQIEQKKKEPTLESLAKISLTFHIPIWILVKGIDKNSIWFNHTMWL